MKYCTHCGNELIEDTKFCSSCGTKTGISNGNVEKPLMFKGESKSLKDKNEKEKQEMIDNIGKVTKDFTNGLSSGAKDVSKNLANTLANPFGKKRDKGDENIK